MPGEMFRQKRGENHECDRTCMSSVLCPLPLSKIVSFTVRAKLDYDIGDSRFVVINGVQWY